MAPREEPKRLIDVKLPLTWLISTTVMIVASAFAVAVNFNRQVDALALKMDTVLASNADLKLQMKERDGKYDALLLNFYNLQRTTDALDLRMSNIEKKGK